MLRKMYYSKYEVTNFMDLSKISTITLVLKLIIILSIAFFIIKIIKSQKRLKIESELRNKQLAEAYKNLNDKKDKTNK